MNEVGWFSRNASKLDWRGIEPPFIHSDRVEDCDGFWVAEYQGKIIGAIATTSKGMDGSPLPTIANLYVLREFTQKGVGLRLLICAMKHLIAAGNLQLYLKATTDAMVRTIERLPPDLRGNLEIDTDLDEDWGDFSNSLKDIDHRGQTK